MKRILLFIPLIFCLCSCWDYTELNMQNYVLGMGVDYIDGKYTVCIETVKITGEPASLSASEGVIIESSGATIFDAVRDAIMSAGKKLYWGHTEVIIISETVAREHLFAVMDVVSRAQDIYSNVNLLVSQGVSAREILNSKTPRDIMVSVHLSNILENEEPSRRFKRCELWQLQRDFPYTLIPAVHLSEHPVIEGSAVIKSRALAGYISGTETQIFSLLEDPSSGGYLPDVTVDDSTLSLEILRTKLTRVNSTYRVDITLSLSSSSKPFDGMDSENRKKVEEAAKALVSEQIRSLMAKPFGNPLSYNDYKVHTALNSTGLIKR